MGTLNSGASVGSGVVGTGQYIGRTKWARAYYDFATDGGAVGAINLRGDKLPSGAVIVSSYIKVDTGLLPTTTSTISIGIESAADIRTAVAAPTAPTISTTGVKQGVITNAAPAVTTAERHIVATIAAGTFTAGAFSVFVEYVELAPVV